MGTVVFLKKLLNDRASLAVQWLRLCTSTTGDMGSIPGWGTKILHAALSGQKKNLLNVVWMLI